jgi:hypothetical protein
LSASLFWQKSRTRHLTWSLEEEGVSLYKGLPQALLCGLKQASSLSGLNSSTYRRGLFSFCFIMSLTATAIL